jgi:hypothetical protein
MTPAARRRADSPERLFLGLLILTAYTVGIAALWAFDANTPSGDHPADPSLSRGISILAGLTLVATVAVGIRYLGARGALRMLAVEAWPGFLAGWALSLLTGFPLRVLVPAEAFWPVLIVVYAVGVLMVVGVAVRVPNKLQSPMTR